MLDSRTCEILLADGVRRAETHERAIFRQNWQIQCAKFHQNRSQRYLGQVLYKM